MSAAWRRRGLRVTRGNFRYCAWMVVGLIVLLNALPAAAQNSFREDFEGAEPSWRDAGGDAPYRIEQHQRAPGTARGGDGAEYLRIGANNGTYVYISHEIGRARAIAELTPTLWLKANRAGLQMLARVVFPRAKDPRTGQPLTTLLSGSSYTQPGHWEQLRLENVSQALANQTRVLRSQWGPRIDVGEAYIDRVLLNVYGGAGVTEVWIDELAVAGYVGRVAATPTASQQPGWNPSSTAPEVDFDGSLLLVGGRPFFPRAVRHQGEPFEFLAKLGFNAVLLSGEPTAAQLREAAAASMWLICAPPQPIGLDEPQAQAGQLAEFGSEWDWVLTWDMGSGLSERELRRTQAWASQIRAADRARGRPLICEADAELRNYSRHVNLLRFTRYPVASSLELADYSTWVRERSRLARPGTPMWATIQTQLAPSMMEQMDAIARRRIAPLSLEDEQVRLLVYTAVAAQARGLCFESQSPLDAPDPQTRIRAANLELLNLELQLVEPWAAGGSFVANVPGSESDVRGSVLATDRTRLLVAIWSGKGSQLVPGQAAGNDISFVIPGVPEADKAFEITPGGLRSLRPLRVTGGSRVTLEEFGLTSLVLMTQDPLALTSLSKRLSSIKDRAARLQRSLAVNKLQMASTLDSQLTLVSGMPECVRWLADSRAALARCDQRLTGGDAENAYLEAHRAMRPLRLIQHARWKQGVEPLPSALTSPLAASAATLPEHWKFMDFVRGSQPSINQLPGGDFENLEHMLNAGWRHLEHPQGDVTTEAELSPVSPNGGQFSLRIKASSPDPDAALGLVETPPIWVESAQVAVTAGQIWRIHGWIRISAPIVGSVDGLMIFDSMSGHALADRIGKTKGWREFTLYRAIPRTGQMTATFALTGLGEAWLDDVTMEPLVPATPSQPRPSGSVPSTQASSRTAPTAP